MDELRAPPDGDAAAGRQAAASKEQIKFVWLCWDRVI
jgi:hypothetical protein